ALGAPAGWIGGLCRESCGYCHEDVPEPLPAPTNCEEAVNKMVRDCIVFGDEDECSHECSSAIAVVPDMCQIGDDIDGHGGRYSPSWFKNKLMLAVFASVYSGDEESDDFGSAIEPCLEVIDGFEDADPILGKYDVHVCALNFDVHENLGLKQQASECSPECQDLIDMTGAVCSDGDAWIDDEKWESDRTPYELYTRLGMEGFTPCKAFDLAPLTTSCEAAFAEIMVGTAHGFGRCGYGSSACPELLNQVEELCEIGDVLASGIGAMKFGDARHLDTDLGVYPCQIFYSGRHQLLSAMARNVDQASAIADFVGGVATANDCFTAFHALTFNAMSGSGPCATTSDDEGECVDFISGGLDGRCTVGDDWFFNDGNGVIEKFPDFTDNEYAIELVNGIIGWESCGYCHEDNSDSSQCRDIANDCCANEASGESAVCADGWVPTHQPQSFDDCPNYTCVPDDDHDEYVPSPLPSPRCTAKPP
ncbi:hypothetical protein TeGR_g5961, partial [Tetraparma gracilis]